MSDRHSTNPAAFREGAREAFGVPAAVLVAGYIGFGALAAENGFSSLMALALACGALAGPPAHLLSPQWSVTLAGLVGGTAAFLAFRLAGGKRD